MEKEQILSSLMGFAVFDGVPSEQLEWLISKGEIKRYRSGDLIFRPGDPIENTVVVLEGRFRIMSNNGQQERLITEKSTGEVTGFLPFSRAKTAMGNARVQEDTTLILLHRSLEKEMLQNHYELSQVLVHEMTSRIREFTNIQKQTEKMSALGKLSAGLAHELNNPASAIVRSAKELKTNLTSLPEKFKKVISIKLTSEQVDHINELLLSKIQQKPAPMGLMDKQEKEDELLDWMDQEGLGPDMDMIATLVEFGFTEEDMEELASQVNPEDFLSVLGWINDNLVIEEVVNEIGDAAERIAKLVQSVKNYTHMDNAPERQLADIHNGIRNTLTMLGYKLRKEKVNVQLDLDPNLPEIPIYVSELNQLWTNILDNAIDAIKQVDHPALTIRTHSNKEFVSISISDNGIGIPKDILDRIWEPFFTTKAMGEGTGLGLDLVHQIMVKHQGSVKVNSQPGLTEFEFCFPINHE
ncbi:ATP-binding protein [Pararhodonellum marinum]|uniref:ATP-binding protein n=1 Tax=Pararhodonellum marinum TaxID=2755358 RepID=UPI00188DD66B|nr:ATP-binding protein [Pararhodonellum marinum]